MLAHRPKQCKTYTQPTDSEISEVRDYFDEGTRLISSTAQYRLQARSPFPYPIPRPNTGIGFHGSVSVGDQPGTPDQRRQHAEALRSTGASWYKVLTAGDSNVPQTQAMAQAGVMPVVRMWESAPGGWYLPREAEVRLHVEAGGPYIEWHNEANLHDEWRGDIPSNGPEIIAANWIKAASTIRSVGGIPLVPALTPGGHVDHRVFTIRFLNELARREALETLYGAVVAVHVRPHNIPPAAKFSDTETVTFDEYRWYLQTYDAYTRPLGFTVPLLGTEDGYSSGGHAHSGYPPMNRDTWAQYNSELTKMARPGYANQIGPRFLGRMYWVESVIHGGSWGLADGCFRDWILPHPRGDDPEWGKAYHALDISWDRPWDAFDADGVPVSGTQPTPDPDPAPTDPAPDRVLVNVPDHISFTWHDAAPGETYWKLTRFEFKDEDTSEGKTNIFSWEPHDPDVMLMVRNQNGDTWSVPHAKAAPDPGADFAKWGGNVYEIWLNGPNGRASDRVHGAQLLSAGGQPNAHVTENLIWQLVTVPEPEDPVFTPTYPGAIVAPAHPTNYSPRPAGITADVVVLHATGNPGWTDSQMLNGTIGHFANPATNVSAHFTIHVDGQVYQHVPDIDHNAAWHAGVSELSDGRTNVNAVSYGIEMVNQNTGSDPYDELQRAALVDLLRWLNQTRGIVRAAVVTHAAIARPAGRKTDPAGLDVRAVLDAVYGASFRDVLLAAGQAHQVINLNPTAALQQRIFAHGFVPTSNEFRLDHDRIAYVAQRAERLSDGAVRIYYVPVGDWENVRHVAR